MAAHPDSGNYWQPKRRGPIRGFSRASRMRMLEKVAGINLQRVRELPLFVTLTYPEAYPSDAATVQQHREAFRMRILRRHPQAGILWKLELQERGAPHLHFMVYNVPFIPYQWVARVWNAIAAPGDAAHLDAGTQVKRCKSHRQAAFYAAKYMGKVAGAADRETWGRRWGIWNARYMPLELIIAPLEAAAAYKLRRWLWAYQRSHGYRRRGRRGRFDGTSAWMASGAMERLISASLGS